MPTDSDLMTPGEAAAALGCGTTRPYDDADPLLTPAEVAALFRVKVVTVTRWARAGKLAAVKTLGGHRRYRESEIRALLRGQGVNPYEAMTADGDES